MSWWSLPCSSKRQVVLAAGLLWCGAPPAWAAEPAAPAQSELARHRFPQPVRVGDLIGRQVLEPIESQPVLGRVRRVVSRPDGSLGIVMSYGGLFGLGSHPITVPLDAMALVGEYVEVIDLTRDQLDRLPPDDGSGTTAVAEDATIQVGVEHPPH